MKPRMIQPRAPRSSMDCPKCGGLISINTPRCIHCGLENPATYRKALKLGDVFQGDVRADQLVMTLCFALYLCSLGLDMTSMVIYAGDVMQILSPSTEALFKLGMGGALAWDAGRWWTPLTAAFLHGDLWHIVFNMLWLRYLAATVLEEYGASRFFSLYILSALSASGLSILMGTWAFVGASGAVYGMFGALIYYGVRRGGYFGSQIFRYALIWAGIGFISGLGSMRVDNWGHLGGLLGGLLFSFLLSYKELRRESLLDHVLAVLALLFTLACFGMMIYTFIVGPAIVGPFF